MDVRIWYSLNEHSVVVVVFQLILLLCVHVSVCTRNVSPNNFIVQSYQNIRPNLTIWHRTSAHVDAAGDYSRIQDPTPQRAQKRKGGEPGSAVRMLVCEREGPAKQAARVGVVSSPPAHFFFFFSQALLGRRARG
jgi:hypothetical protein